MAVFSVVIVTAAPAGLAGEANGAFIKIDGRETVLKSVELFLNRDNIKQILMVVSQETAEEAKRKFGAHLGFSGVKLLSANSKWSDHLAAAAEKISGETTHVVIHDGARPAVPYSDIDQLLAEAEKHPAVALAAPIKSALVEIEEGAAVALHSPSRFGLLQTPVAMTKQKFIESAKSGKELHASEWTLLRGSPLNVRIGSSGEERLLKAMINMLPKPKIKAANNPFDEAQW